MKADNPQSSSTALSERISTVESKIRGLKRLLIGTIALVTIAFGIVGVFVAINGSSISTISDFLAAAMYADPTGASVRGGRGISCLGRRYGEQAVPR